MIAEEPALSIVLVVLAGVLGMITGSFLNVVIWRLPRGESLVSPGSACPKCGHPIRWWDNVPVLSWLILRGKCRDCGAPISRRYPAIELATGLMFAGVAWWLLAAVAPSLPFAASVVAAVAFFYLAAISIALTLIDLDTHTLPNAIVLPAYIVGLVLLGTASILSLDAESIIRGAIGMAAMFVAYLVMALVYPGGMGWGDVKLAGVLGLFLGWLGLGPLIVGAFAAFLLGGLFAIILLIFRRVGRKTGIPFGPWMLVGAWVGVFAGKVILDGYLALFGLGI
jgi:leader peptidase (prepilin peptidase)/N-methyltransferase